MRIKLSILLLLLLTLNLKSQDNPAKITFVDSASYSLFLNHNWVKLCHFGDSCIAQKIDFYNLRYRLGIANFERKRYRIALVHFEKIYLFDRHDSILNSYLYYSYLYSGEYERGARILNQPIVDLLQMDAGVKNSNALAYFGNLYFMDIAMDETFGNGISFFENYGYLSQQNYFETIQQYQYYANATIPFSKNWKFEPAAQLIQYQLTNLPNGQYPFNSFQTSFLVSGMLVKSFNCIDLYTVDGASNLNGANQLQHSIGITWFPLRNNNFDIGCEGVVHVDNYYNYERTLLNAHLYFKPTSRFDGRVAYQYCHAFNTTDVNGLIVNNSSDLLLYKMSVLCNLRLYKQFYLFGLYQFEVRQNLYYGMYNFYTLMGGIKFLL